MKSEIKKMREEKFDIIGAVSLTTKLPCQIVEGGGISVMVHSEPYYNEDGRWVADMALVPITEEQFEVAKVKAIEMGKIDDMVVRRD